MKKDLKNLLEELGVNEIGKVSDGYHTFDELYEYRLLYNASMFNNDKTLSNVHKSHRHSDNEECFGGGWFIVMAYTSKGEQISNHYENKYWDLFKCEERECADKWDGHTPSDVIIRLHNHLK